MHRVCLLVLSALIALPASAQVYQWRDADGKIHYSDQPPAQGEAKTVRPALKPGAPASPSAEGQAGEAAKPKTLAERDLEFRKRREADAQAQAKAEQERTQARERQQACELARNQLSALRSGQRMARFNSQGEREYLDDSTRAAEIERTQKNMDANCQ